MEVMVKTGEKLADRADPVKQAGYLDTGDQLR